MQYKTKFPSYSFASQFQNKLVSPKIPLHFSGLVHSSLQHMKNESSDTFAEVGQASLTKCLNPEYLRELARSSDLQGLGRAELNKLITEEMLEKLAERSNLQGVAQRQVHRILTDPETTNLAKAQIISLLSDEEIGNQARKSILHVLSDPQSKRQFLRNLEDPAFHKSLAVMLYNTTYEVAKLILVRPFELAKQFHENESSLAKLGVGTGLMAVGYAIVPVIKLAANPTSALLKATGLVSGMGGFIGLMSNEQQNKRIWNNPDEQTPGKLLALWQKNRAFLGSLGAGTGLVAASYYLMPTLTAAAEPASTLLKAAGVGSAGWSILDLIKKRMTANNPNKPWYQYIPIQVRLLAMPVATAASSGLAAYALQAQEPQDQSRWFRWLGIPILSLTSGMGAFLGTCIWSEKMASDDEKRHVSKNDLNAMAFSAIGVAPIALLTGKYLKTHG